MRSPSSRSGANSCLYWDCDIPIRPDHVLCYEHYQDYQEGLIDECPDCGRAKDVRYGECLKCYRGQSPSKPGTRGRGQTSEAGKYRREYSPAWEEGDAEADEFFVYILKLDGGNYYPGQTRELRERLSEHRDGKVKSTSGKNPKLVWFSSVRAREEATTIEVELKKLVDKNPREIRRMVIAFKDLVRELDYN